MLAALIASQSLVTLVSAAPTPNDKNGDVVNLSDTFVQKYKDDPSFRKVACFLSKEPKKCTIPTDKSDLAFLFQHHLCDAITTTTKVKLQAGSVAFFNLPFRAYCYMDDNECGKITTANFRKDLTKNKNFFVRVNALCYARSYSNGCSKATEASLCEKFHKELYGEKKDVISGAGLGPARTQWSEKSILEFRKQRPLTEAPLSPVPKQPEVKVVRVRGEDGNYRNGFEYDYGTHRDIHLN